MANNKIQVKRTSTSGRTPNTTNVANLQYIDAGELALNMADGILYSSNGSVLIPVGANLVNQNVSNTLTVKAISANGSNGTSGQVLKSNGTATYWTTDTADVGAAGQILYRNASNVLTTSTGLQYDGVSIKVNGNLESLFSSGDEGGEIFLNKPVNTSISGTGVTIDIFQNRFRIFENGSPNRGAYIDLTAAANGVGSNLLTGGGGGGGTVTSVATGNGMTGGPITGSGTVSVLANTGIIANATGLYVNATYIGTISANNASFLGGTAAASFVQNTDSRTLSGNLIISGTYFNPSANTILLGNSTQRWIISGNSGDFSSTVNAVTSVNSALLSVGTSFIANTTGAYHTGTVNAASITTTGVTVNAIGVYPTSNTSGQNLGTATQRFDAFLDTINVSDTITSNAGANAVVFTNATSKWIYFDTGGAGAPTTTNRSVGTKVVIWPSLSSTAVDYAIGTDNNVLWYSVGQSTASHVWYANSTAILTANQLGLYHNATISGGSYIISTAYTANTTGIYHTGLVNAASYNIGSNFIANTTAVYFGTINATSNGSVLNATTLTIGNSSVNATVNSTTFSGTSNNASNLNGKTEANLNVNNATTAYGKTEGNLNVNSALTSNNASFLGGVAAASYVNTSGSYTLGGRLSFTAGANAILLTNSTSNWIYWADAGFEVPTFTTRSTGTKLVLYPALSGSLTDYALGIDGGVLWSSVPFSNSTYSFKWYGGVTEIASLSGAGNLLLSGSANAASYTVGTSTVANSTGVYAGVVNATTVSVGTDSIMNSSSLVVNTSTFFVASNGNIGMGTVAPTVRLLVNGAIRVTGGIAPQTNSSSAWGTSTQRIQMNANTIDMTGNLTLSTASMIVANGAAGSNGQVLTSNGTTVYWSTAASGGSGGGYYYGSNGTVGDSNNKNNIFRVNANTLFANVTFIAGENGSAAGPIAINSGVFLTIEPGARVAIV